MVSHEPYCPAGAAIGAVSRRHGQQVVQAVAALNLAPLGGRSLTVDRWNVELNLEARPAKGLSQALERPHGQPCYLGQNHGWGSQNLHDSSKIFIKGLPFIFRDHSESLFGVSFEF